MFKTISLLALASSMLWSGLVRAETLQLTGKAHWLLLASSKDKDQAIGIARRVSGMADTVKVVTSKSGYFGVIAGPYEAKSIKELRKTDKDSRIGDLPKDSVLTQGANYIETVWQAKPSEIRLTAYSLDKSAEFTSGPLTVKIAAQKLGTDNAYTTIDGKDAQGPFHFDIGKDLPKDDLGRTEEFMRLTANMAGIAKLVAGSPTPQIVVTNYSGGAHCCTNTSLMSRDSAAAAWTITAAPALDGGGYGFEDVDGDGVLELTSNDNRFLYAFDSYAGSFAPLKIGRLKDGKIVDVSNDPALRSSLVQDLAGIEYDAKLRPEIWKQNGFLAGWVASKIRLGQGDVAWTKFMANYEKDNGFNSQECTTGQKVDDCPQDKLKSIPVPKALAKFLRDNGYSPLPAAAQKELN